MASVELCIHRAINRVSDLILAARRVRGFAPDRVRSSAGRRYARRTVQLWLDAVDALRLPSGEIPEWVEDRYGDVIQALPGIWEMGGIDD